MADGNGKQGFHVVIAGSGFAGICMGIRLKQAGIENFTIYEQADGIGGTWYANDYPGAACDVQSFLYSYSFEPKHDWSRMFGPQAEILAYLNHCADKYGLRPHIRLNSELTGAQFDDASGLWNLTINGREAVQANAVVSCVGGLSRPILPQIKGIESFKGQQFHSAQWDHSYDMSGKTVAVIGTGASAIQIVPAIAPKVGKLELFQRTPPWIMPKPDRDISGIEKKLFKRFPFFQRLFRRAIYWGLEARALGFVVDPRVLKIAQNVARWHLRRQVRDPALRAKLTPNYTMGCKRVLISNDYYPALTRSNVDVVTEAIQEITPRGVRTRDGVEHAVDAIVFGTGFQAAEAMSPFSVSGRNGKDLNEAWSEGPEAYLGSSVTGFPSMYMIVGPNTGLGHSSMIFMIESQAQYVLSAIQELRQLRDSGAKFLDLKPEVQAKFNRALQKQMARTVWSTGGCVSWYQTASGKNTTLWPGFTFRFRQLTRKLRSEDYEKVS